MYPLNVATVANGQSAKPVGASLLAMLLRNPNRQQAGSYKRLRISSIFNGYIANQMPQVTRHGTIKTIERVSPDDR
jgi:hypothetical protein